MQAAIVCEQRVPATVFGDNDSLLAQNDIRVLPQKHQGVLIVALGFIRRIEKNNIRPRLLHSKLLRKLQQTRQTSGHGNRLDLHTRRYSQRRKVRANGLHRGRSAFNHGAAGGPTAHRLDRHRARTGIKIDHMSAANPISEHIEKRLAQTVAGGPGIQPARGLEETRAELSCDDAHATFSIALQSKVIMFRTSLPAGKILGVDIRVHLSFPILLLLAVVYGTVSTGNAMRGAGLWTALVFAVIVRETARALAGAYAGLDLRTMFLLPVGGVMAFAPNPPGAPQPRTWLITAAGPVANVLCGLMMLGACYAFVPGVHLFVQPWLSIAHILRSTIWMQFALAVLGLQPSSLPARPVPVPRRKGDPAAKPAATSPAAGAAGRSFTFNVGSMAALSAALLGLALMNVWLICLGAFFFFMSQIGSPTQQALAARGGDGIRVRDVMLTQFALLSASDTLSGALQQSLHSVQDVFPVLRGDRLVGAIARTTLAEQLRSGGDSFLQGAMTKVFPIASPDEPLMDALRRTSTQGASEFIPVADDGVLVGILTPASLSPDRLSGAVQFLTPPSRTQAARGDD
jgi:CBS domain-containing protein